MPAMASIEQRLKAEAAARGFALAGVAAATDADTYHLYQRWLARGFAGEMHYLHSQGEARRHPSSIHETVRSVLMLGMEYGAPRSAERGTRNEDSAGSAVPRSALRAPRSEVPTPRSPTPAPRLRGR